MGLNCLPCVCIKVKFLSKFRGCESCNHPWTHIYRGVKSHLALPPFVFWVKSHLALPPFVFWVKSHLALPPFVFLGHCVNQKRGMQK
jgi:hypothetical protein